MKYVTNQKWENGKDYGYASCSDVAVIKIEWSAEHKCWVLSTHTRSGKTALATMLLEDHSRAFDPTTSHKIIISEGQFTREQEDRIDKKLDQRKAAAVASN